jgi:hypothetical protein
LPSKIVFFFTPNTVGLRPVINKGATSGAGPRRGAVTEVANYFTNYNSKQTRIPPIVKRKNAKQFKYPVNNHVKNE